MSNRKVMDLPAICSFILGFDRVTGHNRSGQHQSSARLRSLKAGTVSLAGGDGGPPWCGTEDKPTQGHCEFSVQVAGR